MRKALRFIAALAVLAALVLLARSIAYTPAQSFELRTTSGAPVADAYAAYYHESSVFNFVDSLSRYYPGALIRADAAGRLHIPARWSIKPFLNSQPVVRLEFVYAPQLHNAPPGGLGVSIDGVLTVDQSTGVLTLHDLSDSVERWEQSLGRLFSVVRFDLWPDDDRSRVTVSRTELEPLVRALDAEYRAFSERHGETSRRWAEDIAQLKREWARLGDAER